MPNEALLVRTLVELADNLVDDFDVVELLSLLADRCVEVLGVSAAGVMLAAPEGDLRVVASSSEAMRVVELFELQSDEGPCLDCYRSGEPVVNEDLTTAAAPAPLRPRSGRSRLPLRARPAPAATGLGHRRSQPLRRRRGRLGRGGYRGRAGPGRRGHHRHPPAAGRRESRFVIDQLNTALTSRVVIEQAKGVLAERAGLSMESAFEAMRRTPATTTSASPTSPAGHRQDPGPGRQDPRRPPPPEHSFPFRAESYSHWQFVRVQSATRDPGGALLEALLESSGVTISARTLPPVGTGGGDPGRTRSARKVEPSGLVQDGGRGPVALDGGFPGVSRRGQRPLGVVVHATVTGPRTHRPPCHEPCLHDRHAVHFSRLPCDG